MSYINSLSADELLQARAAGRLLTWPEIRRGKTVYWIWADMVMPCTFVDARPGCNSDRTPTVFAHVRTKKERVFLHPKARLKCCRRTVVEKGCDRYLTMDALGTEWFLNKEDAEKVLAESAA